MARKRKPKKRPRRGKGQGSAQETLVKALNHPVRVEALTILSERIASPAEISAHLEVPLGIVSYHVRVLADLGLVEIVEEEPVRGAVAHFYKAVRRQVFDNADWQELAPKVRSVGSAYEIDLLISDVARSLAADIFDRRSDRHLTRIAMRLDEMGWQQIEKIQTEAIERIRKVQESATERLSGSATDDAVHAVVAMLLFEAMPWSAGPADQGA